MTRMTRMVLLVLAITAVACDRSPAQPDAAKPDATPDAAQACSATAAGPCSSSEYCNQLAIGAVLAAPEPGCAMLPDACATTPTCACLLANLTCPGGAGPGCTDDAHQLVFTCAYP